MKPARLTLIVLAVIALLGVLFAALALTPAVQRWALLRLAADRPGLHLAVDSISAGPATIAVRGLELEQGGVRIGIERLDADYSLWQLLFGSRLEMDRVTATGVTVDASRVSRNRVMAGALGAPAAAVQVKLPLEIVLGELEIAGRARLPGAAGRPAVGADFKFSGGHFSPGREGTLRLSAQLVDRMPGARVSALDVQAGLQLKQSLNRSFDRVGLTALIDATGPQISGEDRLKVVADLSRTLSGEDYLVHVDTLSNGRSEDILVASARVPHASRKISGEWSLTARSSQIEPFMIGGALPRFDAKGTGTFAFDLASRAGALRGSLQASASDLEALRPALRAWGAVSVKSDFDVAADAGAVHLNRLDLSIAGDKPVLDLHSSGAVTFHLKEHRLQLGSAAAGPAVASPPGEFVRLRLTGVPLAWARPFLTGADISGGDLTGEIALVGSDGHDLVARTLTPLRAEKFTVVRGGRTLLADARLTIEAEAGMVPAGVEVHVRALTLTSPGGDSLKAQGVIDAPVPWGGPLAIAGDFSADFPGALGRPFPGGRLRVQGGGDCTFEPGRIEVRRLSFEAGDDKGQRLVSATVSRPFGLDPAAWRADTGPAEVELGRASIGRLPLGLFSRWLGPFAITGNTSPDEFVLKAEGDKLKLTATSPLLLADINLRRGGLPWLDGVSLEFSPEFDLAGGVLTRGASGEVLMRDDAGAPLAKFTGELVRIDGGALRANANFNVELPVLGGQPVFARAQALSAGQASGEIRAAADGGGIQIEARATLNGLVGRDGAQTLPVANLGFRGVFQPGGHFSIKAPVLLDSAGQRSDLSLSAEGARQAAGTMIDARLEGDHIELRDLLLLTAAAGAPLGSEGAESSGAQSRALSPPAADEKPFWSGCTGRVALDCKEVTWGNGWKVNGVKGRLELAAESLALQNLEADFGNGSRLAAHGEIGFAPGLNPYVFSGGFTLNDFDAGRFFKALEPDRPPTLEGTCTLQGSLGGQGLTLDDTLDRTRGQCELTSAKGVFRGLKRASDKVTMASKAVEWSAALGALLKTGKVKEAAEKVAGDGYYVDLLAQTLAECRYDQLSLKLVREESMDVQLRSVTLVTPEVRLLGSGQVTYQPGKSLLEQPLKLSLGFASRGRVEQILGKLHLLDGTRDELDYARAKEPVVIGGTLAHPDPIPYYLSLLGAKGGG